MPTHIVISAVQQWQLIVNQLCLEKIFLFCQLIATSSRRKNVDSVKEARVLLPKLSGWSSQHCFLMSCNIFEVCIIPVFRLNCHNPNTKMNPNPTSTWSQKKKMPLKKRPQKIKKNKLFSPFFLTKVNPSLKTVRKCTLTCFNWHIYEFKRSKKTSKSSLAFKFWLGFNFQKIS